MKVSFYNNWQKNTKNVFTPCLWYSSNQDGKGAGIDVFGFGFWVSW